MDLKEISSIILAIAVLHTFCVKRFSFLALRFPEGSLFENLFHLLAEVEIVFGLWAFVFLGVSAFWIGAADTIHYAEGLNFTEALFVFVIMTISATFPIMRLATGLIYSVSQILPIRGAFYFVALVVGPLLGSFITEPAAMTITALVLEATYFSKGVTTRFKYVTLATLFVNISIGGVLTHFAAPPVLMVAGSWGWNVSYMFSHFGWKALIAVSINSVLASVLNYTELSQKVEIEKKKSVPLWVSAIHIAILCVVVVTNHHPVIFVGFFLFFLGFVRITSEFQEELRIRESLLVGFFLAGLVVLGGFQSWWLSPLLAQLSEHSIFLAATALTAVVDNAALTYLGSQVSGISEATKYFLVAGAVAGGGLTVIANAPNPAGFSILNKSFGDQGISPLGLFLAALLPTLIAMACFWFF